MSFTPETILRQWQTLRLIPRHPRRITATDLCNKLVNEGFNVSKRTIERDLQSLALIFPLTSDERSKPYGWSWQKDAPAFDLPGLSNSQAVTLLLAREHLRPLLPASALAQLHGLFDQAQQTLEALEGHLGIATWLDKIRVIPSTQPLLPPQVDEDVLTALHESLLHNKQCEVKYLGRGKSVPEHYPVHPLALVQRGQVLYLVCSIKTYPDIRLLALHRIQQATVLVARIKSPAGFDLDTYLSSGAFGWFPKDAVRLEALFSADVATHLGETPLTVGQVLKAMPDGQVLLTAMVKDTLQLRWWLQGFGNSVEVIAPLALRQEILESANKIVQRYETSDANVIDDALAS